MDSIYLFNFFLFLVWGSGEGSTTLPILWSLSYLFTSIYQAQKGNIVEDGQPTYNYNHILERSISKIGSQI